MIRKITIKNFKSLRHVELEMGRLNLFFGPNASGKSNFFDALRLLQGIGYGFTVNEIFNGKPKSASSIEWDPIRGGGKLAAYTGPPGEANPDGIIGIGLEIGTPLFDLEYSIELDPLAGVVRSECLRTGGQPVYDTTGLSANDQTALVARFWQGEKMPQLDLEFDKSRPILHQLSEELARRSMKLSQLLAAQLCLQSLSNMQRIDPSPHILRGYSQATEIKRMGERGENFAALVNSISQSEKSRSAYLSWLQQLSPDAIEDVKILKGAVGEPLFAVMEGGQERPATILSDGTLRFAAITAAFFQPDLPGILTIEEIENGIHPSRLRLLVEMLRSQSEEGHLQVMATTHSPVVLAWLNEVDFQHAFYCLRDLRSGTTTIRPLASIPGFLDIVRRGKVADLVSEAWLEGAALES